MDQKEVIENSSADSSTRTIPVEFIQKLLAETDLQKFLNSLTQYVEAQFPPVRALILIYDRDRKALVPGSHFSMDKDFELPLSAKASSTSQAAFHKTRVLATDLSHEKAWQKLFFKSPETLEVQTSWALPILSSKQELLGTWTFFYPQILSDFPPESDFYQVLSNLAAVSLERHNSEKHSQKLLSQLQTSEERLKLALQAQKMGVWDLDTQSGKLIWDSTALQNFGLEPEDFQGSIDDFFKCVHPEDVEFQAQAIGQALKSSNIFEGTFRIIRKGEIRHLAGVGMILRDADKNPVRMIGLNWDVTEKIMAQKKMDAERANAVAHSKMASLGEMASGVAHEINNPLTIILNRASQLKIHLGKGPIDQNWALGELAKIESTVERIAKIIRGLRALSRNADSDPMTSCSFNIILEDTLELCQERLKRHGISIRVRGRPEPVALKCRPSQISQVLLNLFNNALDAIAGTQDPWIEVEITEENGTVRLRVTDSGHGIPAQVAQRMMEPFFSTKEVGKGTGLGLSISKGIIENHGGKIWLDSGNPHTSFVIELPQDEAAQTQRPSGPPTETVADL